MKTADKSISNASFTVQLFRLSINKLQQIIAVRWIGFTGFVLLCVVFRYFVVSEDENMDLKTQQINIKNTYKKMEIWPAEVMLDQYVKAKKIKIELKNEQKKFKDNMNEIVKNK